MTMTIMRDGNTLEETITETEDLTWQTKRRVYGVTPEERVNSYPSQGRRAITRRIRELESETDRETACALSAAALSVVSVAARRNVLSWLLLGCALPLFASLVTTRERARRALPLFSFRPRASIEAEKVALQIIRGDFDDIGTELHRRACAMNVLKEADAAVA